MKTQFLFKCYLKSFSMRLIITHMLSSCPPVSKCLFCSRYQSNSSSHLDNGRILMIITLSFKKSVKNNRFPYRTKAKKKLYLKNLKYNDQGNKVLFNYTRAMLFCCALCIFKMKDGNNLLLFMVMNSTVHTHSRVIEIKMHPFPIKVNPF